jgi:hypothetical protein
MGDLESPAGPQAGFDSCTTSASWHAMVPQMTAFSARLAMRSEAALRRGGRFQIAPTIPCVQLTDFAPDQSCSERVGRCK